MEVFTKFFRVAWGAWGARMTQECFLINLVYHFLIQHHQHKFKNREMKPILLRFSIVFCTVSCFNFERRDRRHTLKEKSTTVQHRLRAEVQLCSLGSDPSPAFSIIFLCIFFFFFLIKPRNYTAVEITVIKNNAFPFKAPQRITLNKMN